MMKSVAELLLLVASLSQQTQRNLSTIENHVKIGSETPFKIYCQVIYEMFHIIIELGI